MIEPPSAHLSVYLSVGPGEWLSGELLRYSILKRTKAQVQFHELEPYSPSKEVIPLSLARWYIPKLQNYKGKALFLTANKIVLDDIEKLFQLEGQKPALACPLSPPGREGYHTDLMRLDCEKLTSWDPDVLNPKQKEALQWGGPESPFYSDFGPLDPQWNQTDKHLFLKELKQALEEEEVSMRLLLKEIRLGHVYPEILQDLARL